MVCSAEVDMGWWQAPLCMCKCIGEEHVLYSLVDTIFYMFSVRLLLHFSVLVRCSCAYRLLCVSVETIP